MWYVFLRGVRTTSTKKALDLLGAYPITAGAFAHQRVRPDDAIFGQPAQFPRIDRSRLLSRVLIEPLSGHVRAYLSARHGRRRPPKGRQGGRPRLDSAREGATPCGHPAITSIFPATGSCEWKRLRDLRWPAPPCRQSHSTAVAVSTLHERRQQGGATLECTSMVAASRRLRRTRRGSECRDCGHRDATH